MNETKIGKQIWQTFVDFLMLSCLLLMLMLMLILMLRLRGAWFIFLRTCMRQILKEKMDMANVRLQKPVLLSSLKIYIRLFCHSSSRSLRGIIVFSKYIYFRLFCHSRSLRGIIVDVVCRRRVIL